MKTRIKQWFAAALVAGAGVWSASAAMTHSAAVVDTRADVLAEILPEGCTYALDGDAVLTVTFTENLSGGQFVLPDDFGPIVFDLNGQTLVGAAGADGTAATAGGDGAWLFKVGDETTVTVLDSAGTDGRVVGGKGGNGHPAGAGAFAFVDADGAPLAVTDEQGLVRKGADGGAICVETEATQTATADWLVLNGSTGGQTIGASGATSYYYITADTVCNASGAVAGTSGLTIADGATVYLYVPAGVTLTCAGKDGSGQTGGGAGIHLPATSTLYLIGSGTVVANGGAAGNGGAGGDGADGYFIYSDGVSICSGIVWDGWMHTGGGGGGGGGGYAGADIGTGGASGAGGGGGGSGSVGVLGQLIGNAGDDVWINESNPNNYGNGAGGAGGSGGKVGMAGLGTRTQSTQHQQTTYVWGGAGGASGAAGAVGAAKDYAGTSAVKEFAVAYYEADGVTAHGSAATYAVGSATQIVLPSYAGYSWKMSVYGKSCGATSDLTVPVEGKLTGTIDARNVYGDIAFTAVAEEVPVEGDVKVKVDDEWIEKKGLKGKTVEEIAVEMEKEDPGTGMKVWQAYALNDTPEKPVIKSAEKGATKGKVSLAVPSYTVNAKSGVSVSRKLVKTVGEVRTESALALDATAVEVDEADVSAANPVALYKTVVTFTDADGKQVSEERNEVGVMRVETSAQKAIVAVPWEQIGGGAISAADLIDTRDLADGDKLHVYDKAKSQYKTWALSGGAWAPLGTYKIADGKVSESSAGDPGAATIARGDGVWLERGDATKPFHLIGQYNAAKAALPSEEGWNLCGNAGLAEAAVEGLGADDGDIIIVPTAAEPVRYTKKDGKWGCYVETVKTVGGRTVKTSKWEVGGTVGVGQGFWRVK